MKFAPLLTLVLVLAVPAVDAQAPPIRVRGIVQSLDGPTLVLATPADGSVTFALTDATGINGLEAKTAADITDNVFIGTTAVKDASGRGRPPRCISFPKRCAAPARGITPGTCPRAR
jgi:hypothetical protein